MRALRLEEDIVFVECTPRYPITSTFAEKLQATHDIWWLKTCPSEMGWPHRRHRLLGVALNKRTMEWYGPPQSELSKDFGNRYNRRTMIAGDVFCMASKSDVENEYVTMAAKQHVHLKPHQIASMTKDELLRWDSTLS